MARNLRGDVYSLESLDLASLNDIFRRLSERLDQLEGLRGEVETHDKIKVSTGIKIVDSDGVVIHGFGDIS